MVLVWHVPAIGCTLGLVISIGAFLLISDSLSEAQLFSWGWRVPFLASTVLVAVGLYIRLRLVETPAFRRSMARANACACRSPWFLPDSRSAPVGNIRIRDHFPGVLSGQRVCPGLGDELAGIRPPSISAHADAGGVVSSRLTIPFAGPWLICSSGLRHVEHRDAFDHPYGFSFKPLFGTHDTALCSCFWFCGFGLAGISYGAFGSALATLFPTPVRYTGTSRRVQFLGNPRRLAGRAHRDLVGLAIRLGLRRLLFVGCRAD